MSSTIGALVGGIAAGLALGWMAQYRGRRLLRQELEVAQQRVNQRLDLFYAVVEAAPMALVLLRTAGTIVVTNPMARELFFEGNDPAGKNLLELLHQAPGPFRDALLAEHDTLFTVGGEGDAETYHLSKRPIPWEGETLSLVLVRHMTRELRRQEVAVWKKLLRVISHELNNSLAPISSMAHTARLIAGDASKQDLLDEVFATIEERTQHLKSFLEGYASLARLPAPRPTHVAWTELTAHVGEAHPRVQVSAPASGTGWFDRAQVEQLLLNLIKNAEEAGGVTPEVQLSVQRAEGGWALKVRDHGPGMSEEVLRKALLPFYSTKPRGTGLGLALAREIMEAHEGKIELRNCDDGGLEVACLFPDFDTPSNSRARLTVTRV